MPLSDAPNGKYFGQLNQKYASVQLLEEIKPLDKNTDVDEISFQLRNKTEEGSNPRYRILLYLPILKLYFRKRSLSKRTHVQISKIIVEKVNSRDSEFREAGIDIKRISRSKKA